MSYMCKQSDRECDACGYCEPDPMFYCAGCSEPIYADESSYMMGGEVVCGVCWVTGIEEEVDI